MTPVNDPPVIESQSLLITGRNVPLTITMNDVTFTDPDNAPSEHHLTLLGGTGYTLNGDTVRPDLNFYGDLNVNAALSDLQDTVDFTLLVTVTYSNIPPRFTSVPITEVNEKDTYTYVVTASDPDTEDPQVNQTLSFWADSIPGWLTFNGGNGILFGFPTNADVGQYPIRLGVTDGIDSVYQAFTLKVLNVNDPPVITGQHEISGTRDSFRVLTVSDLIVEDPDNTPAELKVLILPGQNYTFHGDTLIFSTGYTGDLDVSVKVNDGTDDSNVFSVIVHVNPGVGVPPVRHGMLAKVYPNPAGDFVIFEVQGAGTYDIVINNVEGKNLIMKKLRDPDRSVRIDLSGLPAGIYLYRISNREFYQAGKLVIR